MTRGMRSLSPHSLREEVVFSVFPVIPKAVSAEKNLFRRISGKKDRNFSYSPRDPRGLGLALRR